MKRFLIVALLSVSLFSSVYLLYYKKNIMNLSKDHGINSKADVTPSIKSKNNQSSTPETWVEERTDEEKTTLEETLGLSLKGVNLFQGEKGIELWRLKASWAHLLKDKETIEVDNPIVKYTLGDGTTDDAIIVTANKGKITNEYRFITLWGDLCIAQESKNIISPTMIYDSQQRELQFPKGVLFTCPIATTTAGKVIWNLASNIITGTNGIQVTIYAKNTSDKGN